MSDQVWQLFTPLWDDIDEKEEFYNRKPLLAHYTSISNVERILTSRELWFANPLYMNDSEEVGFGIEQGSRVVRTSVEIEKACGSRERHALLLGAFEKCYWGFARDHVIDTFVFCMSEHSADDLDGLLSMWRGYGGSGSGVALVFDAGKINLISASALILARVYYGTAERRIAWLEAKTIEFASILARGNIADTELHVAAVALFERIKLFALFTKHTGFSEEREWRVVYMPNRDAGSLAKKLSGYSVGNKGVEPRLKFRLSNLTEVGAADLSLDAIVNRIILGPTTSTPLAIAGFKRLLDASGHSSLKEKVHASGIPLRARL
jgi:hypothetical protein